MVGQNVATSTVGTIDVQVRELKSAFCKLSYILMLIGSLLLNLFLLNILICSSPACSWKKKLLQNLLVLLICHYFFLQEYFGAIVT